ncbi:MAG: hypothetical protein COA39_012275 [Sulfurimonas sp.]|nr:hypothetical protein [Sulfurimonas sp.]
MAKLDRAKELIDFLKAIFVLAVAINLSLVAWLFIQICSEKDSRVGGY